MVQNIRAEFKSILSQVSWMDATSKKSAQEKASFSKLNHRQDLYEIYHVSICKADLIDVKIGYPDYTYNDTYLNNLYKNVPKHLKHKIYCVKSF
jgi:hypothetical protein